MKELNLNWEFIADSCSYIANELKDKNIQTVVGIARGGVIPGSIIARQLNARFVTIHAQSYTEENTQSDLKIDVDGLNGAKLSAAGNIVFVDDICDTGVTLNTFYTVAKTISPRSDIYTASIIFKEQSNHTPTSYFKLISDDDTWVIFPWETK